MTDSRPAELYLDEKWDQAIDLALRRVVYGGLAGGAAGFFLFGKRDDCATRIS